jgi:glycosyltransferase involved in cell wall biosynthesis
MEAMSCGCPAIASHIGGLPDLVDHGETGLLVQPGDALELRQAIERLMADPNLRHRMGKAALHKVIEFQASSIVPRIEKVYEEVVSRTDDPNNEQAQAHEEVSKVR